MKGGGIRARNVRGRIGSTWWSERWIATLESFGWSNRLERGRRYARMGQVMDFDMSKGAVTARVQGSRPKPYSVTISVKPLQEAVWRRVVSAMGSKAVFAAKLLAGEMPDGLEELFASCGAPLFPAKKEIKTDCSCPDPVNPCKHIAAVHYILAEEFDRDPFMIFRLRGKSREELTKALRRAGPREEKGEEAGPAKDAGESRKPLPLGDCIQTFWYPLKSLDGFRVSVEPPRVDAAVIRRLGEPPSWRERENFVEMMQDVYRAVTKEALRVAFETAERTAAREEKAGPA